MGKRLVLVDEDTGEVLQVVATADDLAKRAVHKAVMNHVHNSLGALPDEQIVAWVRETVASLALGSLQDKVEAAVKSEVRKVLLDNWSQTKLRNIAAEILAKQLQITVAADKE